MLGRIRVKYCGITRREDAQTAARVGVDAIGLVFYRQSPRAVTVEQARSICDGLPAFVTTVGLFVDAPAEEVRQVADAVSLDLLQFHGDEPEAYCSGFGRPYIKAIRVARGRDYVAQINGYQNARGLLLDTFSAAVPGGTGEVFDWDLIPETLPRPLILAGGLSVENVADAIKRVQPYAVDVSGGIESAKGIKHADKMQKFMQEVHRVGTGES